MHAAHPGPHEVDGPGDLAQRSDGVLSGRGRLRGSGDIPGTSVLSTACDLNDVGAVLIEYPTARHDGTPDAVRGSLSRRR